MLPNENDIAAFFARLGHRRPMLYAFRPIGQARAKTILWGVDDPVDTAAGLACEYHSVYTNLNPIRPEVTPVDDGQGLADWMIAKRTRILLDVDGDGDKATAWQQTCQIREAIAGGMLGEPELPIVETDHGNGYALIYECDMENDEPSKRAVKKLLRDLKASWNHVDLMVSNAGRYTRVAGTLNQNKITKERILTKLLGRENETCN